jgi:hypothetical protein
LVDLDPRYGDALVQCLGPLELLLRLLQSRFRKVDVCDPNCDFLGPGAVRDPGKHRFGCRKVRLVGLEFSLDISALHPHKMLACLNPIASFDQQFRYCSGC